MIEVTQDKRGAPLGWWTVIRDGKALHHFPGEADAKTLAYYLRSGYAYREALRKLEGSE